jgi:hypothetical protein
MRVFATYAQAGSTGNEPWRLTAVSAHSAERARSLAEREQRRPGSEIKDALLTVVEFESMPAVPWQLPAA